MKLKNKLFVNFTILLFVLLNIFGYFLIQTIFINTIDKTIADGYKEYSAIYLNLKSGEDMSKLLFAPKEVIRLKNDSYLRNAGASTLNLQVQDSSMNTIYKSMSDPITLPYGMNEFDSKDSANSMITSIDDAHTLIINKEITFGEETYQLSYINTIENIYAEKLNYFILLLAFDVFAGVVSIILIYYFASEITKPLDSFIRNINEIIHRNYETKLNDDSNILEIKELSQSFNTMNDEIASQIQNLELKNEQQQRFIDSLTHEIRTPLTSIIGYSSLYLNKKVLDEKTVLSSFESIYQSGKRIESLSENLIKLITLDRTALDIKEINIKEVFYDIQKSMETRLLEEQVEFIVEGNDYIVEADEYLLTTLFSNFIDNGIKASSAKEDRYIHIRIVDNNITISDNGKGIPKKEIPNILEPFFMVDQSRKNTNSGFGLGLAICNDIMKIFNIEFDIESEVDEGTTVKLTWNGGLYEEE